MKLYLVKCFLSLCFITPCSPERENGEALLYKSGGRRLNSRLCHWNFSLTYPFLPQNDPGVESASNRNEYQEYFPRGKGGRCVGLKNFPPSFAYFPEIWEPPHPGNHRKIPGLIRDCFCLCSPVRELGIKNFIYR